MQGCAGSGAPRTQTIQQDAYPAQRDVARVSPVDRRACTPAAPVRQDSRNTESEAVAAELVCDPDAQERADLIEMCLSRGFSDEEIEGVLREHMMQKMMAQEQERNVEPPKSVKHPSQSSLASQLISKSQESLSEEYTKELYASEQESSLTANVNSMSQEVPKPAISSVAAKRQAKAASLKSVSFGPSDEEIAGLLEDHAYGRTPSPQMEAKGGIQNNCASDARAAFLESQRQAAAVKARNRNGQGIF